MAWSYRQDRRDTLVHLGREGVSYVQSGNLSLLAASGAVPIFSGIYTITLGSAAALTLAAPVAGEQAAGGDDGKILQITSTTAFAHVITSPSGTVLDGTTGAKVTITLAAFPGASVTLVAYNTKWYLLSKTVATIA